MANIKIHLNNIKNALFGNEVRGSIHDGIDAINKEVESTTKRQVKLEETQNQLIINAGNSNAEVVAGRVKEDGTSFDTIGDRMADSEGKINVLDTTKVHKGELVINVKDFGAKGDGVSDDTEAIRLAINYASQNLAENTTGGSKPSVYLPSGKYNICDLYLYRNMKFYGDGVLSVIGENATGLILDGALFCSVKGITILLNSQGQTGIHILTNNNLESASQLNSFKDVTIDGNYTKDSVGIKIDYAWVNSFYSCKIFRCGDGVQFNDDESNANMFYGCEIRHNLSDANSKLAILQRGGKGNAFIGGVIENYKSCIDVRNGDFKLVNVYTEAFAIDRPFLLSGGSLTLDGCLLKGKFEIRGGDILRISNCDANKGGYTTSNTSPLILFTEDVDTEIKLDKNSFPNDIKITRYREYLKNSIWNKRANAKEFIQDRKSIVMYGIEGETIPLTGDGNETTIPFNKKIVDLYGEFEKSTGVFTPLNGGIFRVNIYVKLNNLTDEHDLITLFIKESNGKSYRVDYNKSANRDYPGTGSLTVAGSVLMQVNEGQNIRASIKTLAATKSKSITVDGGTGNNIWSYISIERVI